MLEYINTKRKLHHSFVSIPIYIQISHAKNEYSNPHHESNKIFKDSPSNLHQLENSYKNLFLTKMIYIQLKHGKRNRRFSTMKHLKTLGGEGPNAIALESEWNRGTEAQQQQQQQQVLALHLSAGPGPGCARLEASNSTAFTHSKQRTREQSGARWRRCSPPRNVEQRRKSERGKEREGGREGPGQGSFLTF